ncbi:helix-turn-helix domain-containing protein, partial [Mycobacterium tuberculosis]
RRTVHIYFPFDKIEKLSNSLVHGNKTDSIELVKEMIAENAARDIHFHQFANVAKMMFYQIVRHLPASQTSQQSFLDMEAAFVHKANYSFDYRVIQEELIGIVSYVSALGKQAPKTKMDPAFIAQYIEKHYMENLYLDHMAEIMETSPKYFSNYFKKTFNVNYVEYLNKVRLNHAREWLANSELSITEISEKTGYM